MPILGDKVFSISEPKDDQNFFKSKGLLLIVPHVKYFIEDQAKLIEQYFSSFTVLMPRPYFSTLALKLPRLSNRFQYLHMSEDSCSIHEKSYRLLSPKFFTLPIDQLRKRNCYLATQKSIEVLTKNTVNYDILHAHFLDNGFVGVKLKERFGKPLVVTAHGGDVYDLPFRNSWYNSLAKYVLNNADQVITVSKSNAEKLSNLGVSSKKVHIIPNGYDEGLFKALSSIECRRKLGLPLNKKILLSVGNLVEVKGHVFLIDAMAFIAKVRKDVLLIIVGDGVLKEKLQQRIGRLKLNEQVLLVGRKDHCEISTWMNACDIFVLPSTNEGFPTVIPEAMACGKPVIATAVGGIPEALSNPDIGTLVNPQDSESIAEAVLNVIQTKWQTEAIISYAKKYSWTTIVKEILCVYASLLTDTSRN